MTNPTPYHQRDHSHCWESENPPCGIPLEKHAQCCLCDLRVPNTIEELIKEIKGNIVGIVVAQGLLSTQISPEGYKTINTDAFADNFVKHFKETEDFIRTALTRVRQEGREEEKKQWIDILPKETLMVSIKVRSADDEVEHIRNLITFDNVRQSGGDFVVRLFEQVISEFAKGSKITRDLLESARAIEDKKEITSNEE